MIYFVKPKGKPYVKIGYARHVGERRVDLQIGSPYELVILGVAPGGFAKENLVHERFRHLHVRGEWFHYTREIRDFIRTHAEEYQPEIHDPSPKSAGEDEAWKAQLAAVQPAGQEKRVRVWVQQFNDRSSLMLQWIDPETRRRKTKSAGTSNPDEAEDRRADLEAALNHRGANGRNFIKRNTSRNTEASERAKGVEDVDASASSGKDFD